MRKLLYMIRKPEVAGRLSVAAMRLAGGLHGGRKDAGISVADIGPFSSGLNFVV